MAAERSVSVCARIGPRLVVLLLALLAAGHAARVVWAEAPYREGTGYTENPAHDQPGRLGLYERALARSPENPLYLLRVAQIRLTRLERASARSTPFVEQTADLAARAARLAPLDARIRVVHAQALALAGDRDAALLEARAALRVGPRHETVQVALTRLALSAWRASRDLAWLRLALDVETHRLVSSPQARSVGGDLIATVAMDALTDTLAVAADDADALIAARGWFPGRPEIRAVLDRAALSANADAPR